MIEFTSTRGGEHRASFCEALLAGLAPDGGLYLPVEFPTFSPASIDELSSRAHESEAIGAAIVAPFLVGTPLEGKAEALCRRAFAFPIPATEVEGGTRFLELFHGPTAAFKDIGALFLADCLAAMDSEERTVLVATSGDTGGAVAAAFYKQPGHRVVLLFPADGVSPEQKYQLTCWGGNVHSFAVRGTFDDCQRTVKRALGERTHLAGGRLITANSINVGRLLAQVVYYAASSMAYRTETGRDATFVIPTGNVGNATAALWAQRMGFPVGQIVMATNANRVVPDYLESGVFAPRDSVCTLANAMDVGRPSNLERVTAMFPDLGDLKQRVTSCSVSDIEIADEIKASSERWGRIIDPHTATALSAARRLNLQSPILASTAHPAKFNTVVAKILGREVPLPVSLEALSGRPSSSIKIDAGLDALEGALDQAGGAPATSGS